MTAKEHYDLHLGKVYAWMLGDFRQNSNRHIEFFRRNDVLPSKEGVALDLGAGTGVQAVALATLGFSVSAVDFSPPLLAALRENIQRHKIEIIEAEFASFLQHYDGKVDLITCMGDTLTHLPTPASLDSFIENIPARLVPGGKVVLSYRDLSITREGTDRFFQVRSDEHRSLVCFVEYHRDHVIVDDILLEKDGEVWKQKVSSYPKLRISAKALSAKLRKSGLNITHEENNSGMIHLIAEKFTSP